MCLQLWNRDCGLAQQSSSSLWGRCPAVVERNISRKVDWMSRTCCMASSVTRFNSNGYYPVETPEGARICSPSRGYRRYHAKTLSSCDYDRCKHVEACSRECYSVHCRLPWIGQRPLRTPIISSRCPWFDHLHHLMVGIFWKLNVIGCILYNTFCLHFLTRTLTMENLWANFVSPVYCILGLTNSALLPVNIIPLRVKNHLSKWWLALLFI
jgi:hypothetical protein